MKPIISIIIPVYNVENYLEACLDSILDQTFESYELLLIDDGSTDGSAAIAQKYVDRRPDKVRLFSKENAGPGPARNLGIQKAKGKYILFIDSDDYVNNTMLEELYESANTLDTDVVFCPYYRHGLFDEKSMEGVFDFDADKIYSGADYLAHSDSKITTCTKLYRKSFIKNYPFPSFWYEDVAWLPVVMSYAKKVSYVPRAFYHYLRHDTSIVSSISDKQVLGSVDAIHYIMDNSNPDIKESLAPYLANLLLFMCVRRPAFADLYVNLLLEYKDFITENCNFEEHPILQNKLEYYYNDFIPIPKTIYYDNFGKVELTEEEKENINSWNGKLVEFDAKIICLDESNCDINENPLIKQAYEEKRYAVVGHYFKCKRLLENGGIALSKNVRGVKYITPLLVRSRAFFGFYDDKNICADIYASAANQPVLQDILELYPKNISSDNCMTETLNEIFIQRENLKYSYDMERNFNCKYYFAYNNTIRLYATCVLARDYGIGTSYTNARVSEAEVTMIDGKKYHLVNDFYYQTSLRLTNDYTTYLRDFWRKREADTNKILQRKIGNMRQRLFHQTIRINILKDRCDRLFDRIHDIERFKIVWYLYRLLVRIFPNKKQQNSKEEI